MILIILHLRVVLWHNLYLSWHINYLKMLYILQLLGIEIYKYQLGQG